MNAALRRIALGLGLAVVAIASWLMQGDGPRPDDADLLGTAAPIADHENGFLSLNAASELLHWPEDEEAGARWVQLARGEAWDDALAAEALAANDAALTAFDRAARRAAFQSAPIHDLQADVPDMLPWIQLAQLSGIRALAAAHGGDATSAVAAALAPMQLARRVSGNPNGALISGMVGLTIGGQGLGALEAALPMLTLSAESRRALAADLAALTIEPAAWRAMWASEYRTMRATYAAGDAASLLDEKSRATLGWVARWLPASYLYQPNNSLAAYAARIRALQAAAGASCRGSDQEDGGRLGLGREGERISPLRLLLSPNGVGRMASAEAIPLARFDARRCDYHSHIEAVRAAIALRAFESERGTLPPSLEALVPAYLATAPRDWFSEGALRLDRANRVIYSVGSDGVDGGGREIPGDEDFREPRFPLRDGGKAAIPTTSQSQPSPM